MADHIKKIGNEYYDVTLTVAWSKNDVWVGDVFSVHRKDTDEEVRCGYCRITADRELIKEEVFDKIKKKLPFLSVPPQDWNSRVRKILARCTDIGGKVTGFAVFIDNLVEKGNKDSLLTEKFGQFCHKLASDIIWLVKEIDGLTEHERIELLTSDDEVYSNLMDAFNLDDLTARSEVFDYFIRTSQDEVKAHELHDKRILDAVDTTDDS